MNEGSTMRFRARTTVPTGGWREYPNAEALIAHTRVHATTAQIESVPPPGEFSWCEFMGDMGRCWRVERVT